MSRLRKQIRAALSSPVRDDNGVVQARCCFAPEFVGFQGHFPGNPVLPGVCMVQALLELYSVSGNPPVRLREITQAKFFHPVVPDDELTLRLETTQDDAGSVLLKGHIRAGDKKIADLKVRAEHES